MCQPTTRPLCRRGRRQDECLRPQTSKISDRHFGNVRSAAKPKNPFRKLCHAGMISRRFIAPPCVMHTGHSVVSSQPVYPSTRRRGACCSDTGIQLSFLPCRRRWGIRVCSPLQPTHNCMVSFMASDVSASGPSCPDNARRSEFARPRVRCCFITRDTERWAHHAGVGFPARSVVVAHLDRTRHTAPFRPIQRRFQRGLFVSRVEPEQIRSSILGGSTILPGLNVPSGSNDVFTSRNADTISSPNISLWNSERTNPSPCSPECDPLYSRTISNAASAISRSCLAPNVRF